MTSTPNPNWPLIEDAWGPYWGAKQGILPGNRWSETTLLVRGTTSAKRGGQYELDQVRAGEYRLQLENIDAAFDPTNPASPWAGKVVPFQPFRKRAQYPRTINLLNQAQATGGDVGGQPLGALVTDSIQIFTDTDSGGGSIVTSGTAFRDSRVLQFAVPNASPSGSVVLRTREPSAEPGTTYTVQIRVRNITPSTTVQVKPHIGTYLTPHGTPTYSYGSTVTLTGSATAAWTLLTFTAAMPANTLGIDVGVTLAANATATCSVQADEWQLEKAASASAWVQPGVWSPLYMGYAERWPQVWNDPLYVSVDVTCVDTFALLSQVKLKDPLTQEITSHSPAFLYTFGDPQGSTSFADSAGKKGAASIGVSKYGAGTLTAGNQITATNPVTGIYTGSSGTVVTINNANPGTNITAAATFISLGAAGIKGPANPSSWSRMIAFRYTGPMPTANAVMWSAMDSQRSGGSPSGSRINIGINSSGHVYATVGGPTGAGLTVSPSVGVVDGNWHLAILAFDVSLNSVLLTVDGTFVNASNSSSYAPSGMIADNVGGFVDATIGGGTTNNWQGDIAYACEFSQYLFYDPDHLAMYAAWKHSCAGDSTDQRYARILGWTGYSGGSSIQTGLTTAMGPAAGGTDALSALQEVVTTEGGTHYVDRNGQVTFRSRSDRYNKLTSAYVFGDGPGEYPYEPGVGFDFDPTHLANIVTATQAGTGQAFTAQDQASIDQYFPRTMDRTLNTQNALEVQDAANYLLSRYRQPALRITSIVLNPAANPALWPVCLALELGLRVTVNKRTAAGTLISQPCFIENIQTDIGKDTARWTLQLSPVDTTPYGVFAAFHTQLNASISAGVTSIVIKNGQDNTNPAAAQLGQGQQLVLGLGTTNQETVTIKSVGTTTAGWTTATITLQAATTKAHTALDTVCEPLPAGTTDPTTWDTVSQFDSSAFAY